jgi:uncharacterized protein YdaU (DUF1376 family)
MPEAPYPSETRAKGWRFELDHERIRQSDTWALCPPEYRPWLLMLWMVAWEQTPCGSMPTDDLLVAAKIGMTPKAFAKAKPALMRGWWRADDGRLYHKVIAERVSEMLAFRKKDKARKQTPKGANVDSTGIPPDSTTTPDTGTRTSNSLPVGKGGDAAKRERTPAERRKSELWRAMKEFLVESGESPDLKSAGAIVTKAIQRFDEVTALGAIEATLHKRPNGAIAYLEAACQQAIGQRQNKQESLEAGNLAAAQRFAMEGEQ